MQQIVRVVCGFWMAAATVAGAETAPPAPMPAAPVVVELYTSQGCSSCPPADALLAELAAEDRVIALALHVDYWDYIGWEDRFAQGHFTDRQKAYARAAGSRMIYTPQMIIGGALRVEGNDPKAVRAAIEGAVAQGRLVLTAERKNGRITIHAAQVSAGDGADRSVDEIIAAAAAQAVADSMGAVAGAAPEALAAPSASPAFADPLKVQLVRYRPVERVDIAHGENAGKSLEYHNIVTSWQLLGDWDGAAPLAIDTEIPGDEPAVVILQEPGPGPILAAARVE